MAEYLFLIPLFPLLASIIVLLIGRDVLKNRAHWVSIPAVAASFVVSLLVLIDIYQNKKDLDQHLWKWIDSGSFQVPVGLHADQLTAVMITMVTFVSLLVHIYSVGYMHGDESYYRFFAWLPLFVFSMLVLVMANNYVLIFFGWEAVGLCSYLLIGYFYKRRSAGDAAKKAFIVNRIGDVGFGLGIMLMFTATGSVMNSGPDAVALRLNDLGVSSTTITAIALLLFAGAVGKSAQFPLHVWLPDAMEGPTPVSALIHAATMVTAGIYLVARSYDIFSASPDALVVVSVIGAFTALLGASIALTQNDIKRVVAYSTVSQLGYMTLALGGGLWITAIFHLLTHAFFKATLFLGSGSVIHGMHEEQDMRNMGGLRKYMPITFVTFLIASLANAGVPPFAGFWSKDEIITGTWESSYHSGLSRILTVVAIFVALLTALYMFRLVFMVFFGKPRFDTEHIHPHESPWTMTVPLIILATVALLGGIVGWPPDGGKIHHFLEPVFSNAEVVEVAEVPALASAGAASESASLGSFEDEHSDEGGHAGAHEISHQTMVIFAIISSFMALLGIVLAYLTYMSKRIDPKAVAEKYSGIFNLLNNKWYIDAFYDNWIVLPMRRFSLFLWQEVDVKIIDGAVMGVASSFSWLSSKLRRVQTGLVGNYALAIALGMVVIVGIYFAGFSDLFR
jgi:NADH-quinone oxidoreductase subunit L